MRTSKLSQETTRSLAHASPRLSRRSAISYYAHNESSKSSDIEDVILPPSKRPKLSTTVRSPGKRTPRPEITVKSEVEESVIISPSKGSRVRKPARKVKSEETGEVEVQPPTDWAEVYDAVRNMRKNGNARCAAVDTMGCERMGDDAPNARDKRYHTLTALMLSSQTKDTTNAVAMGRLTAELPPHKEGAPKGLNLNNVLAVDPKLLNELIWVVGFHNNKTKYIKATAEILRDQWKGDIPDTPEGLMSLPGVGPKMAYLCLSSAWGKTLGIGVDVHVHRITNLWGWHKTKNPEETRLALQAWLPQELWHEINWLLVGLGQTVCLPVGRKCGDCDLGLRRLCKVADRSKVTLGRKTREVEFKKDDEGVVIHEKERKETITQVAAAPKPDSEVDPCGTVLKVDMMEREET